MLRDMPRREAADCVRMISVHTEVNDNRGCIALVHSFAKWLSDVPISTCLPAQHSRGPHTRATVRLTWHAHAKLTSR